MRDGKLSLIELDNLGHAAPYRGGGERENRRGTVRRGMGKHCVREDSNTEFQEGQQDRMP